MAAKQGKGVIDGTEPETRKPGIPHLFLVSRLPAFFWLLTLTSISSHYHPRLCRSLSARATSRAKNGPR
jgi:hypothetical protein